MQEEKTFTYPCPYCGQQLASSAGMVGSSVKCPSCGGTLMVPERPKLKIVVVKKGEGFFSRYKIPIIVGGAVLAVLFLFILAAIGAAMSEEFDRSPTAEVPELEEPARPPVVDDDEDVDVGDRRKFVRDHIEENGNCRVVAITKTGGNVVVSGDNDWAAVGCSKDLTRALQKMTDDEVRIVDVCLTEDGEWVVLHGGNGAQWSNIPSDMERQLRKLNDDGEKLYSATFNDAGDWIVVASEHYVCSETWLTEWLTGGRDKYGTLRAATVTDDAAVAVYDRGFKFYGNVPEEMKKALGEVDFDVRIIKIAGNDWFIANASGSRYQGKM